MRVCVRVRVRVRARACARARARARACVRACVCRVGWGKAPPIGAKRPQKISDMYTFGGAIWRLND